MPEFYCVSLKGERQTNEDVLIVRKKKTGEETYMAAVFDGHGGPFVSSYLGRHMLSSLAQATSDEAAADTVRRMHETLVKEHPQEVKECGSTVLVCRVVPERRYVQTINLGDSRAVLNDGGRVVDLSRDHKPGTRSERSRIRGVGHKVEWDAEDEVHRVNGYSVSRAIGDTDGGRGISKDSDVTRHYYGSRGTRYLILACDGVWDVLSSKEACAFVDSILAGRIQGRQVVRANQPGNLAYSLAKHAISKGSMDNVSVVVAVL